jgi:hypothetical protein
MPGSVPIETRCSEHATLLRRFRGVGIQCEISLPIPALTAEVRTVICRDANDPLSAIRQPLGNGGALAFCP